MGIFSTEGNLADLIDEFLDSPFMGDDQFAVPDFFAQALGRKGAAEDDFMRILGDVDEAAAAGDAVFELADVDVAFGVTFCHAQESHIQAAAIVKVELIRMVDDSIGVGQTAKVRAAGRYAADRPRPGRGKVKAATRPSISTPAALTATRPCASCSTNTWKTSSPRGCWS